ncbi:membrane protein [Saccharothrix mutabilis subsp. mutabilis]|uniref:Membrane protein n=1 Tax=Saccharothrix mutabilis subsp. mutabilis TaxID=66855 RepID=A0ABN0TQM4_9PSEU
MPNLPTTEELRKAGEQAVAAARTPLLAALGAGDLAAKAVIEALNKAKERVEAGKNAAESTDFTGLKDKFDPAELRKVVDAYTQSALNLYQFLAEHGQEALDKLKSQPQVQKALHQVEEAVETAQKRTGAAATEARELADDVLGKVTRRTRSIGEKVASDVDDASEKLAEAVVEVGGDVAHEVRSTTRKAANRTAAARTQPARKPATTRATTPKKPGTTK